MERQQYCIIGEKRQSWQPEDVWELDISRYISGAIDPRRYFITSGEAAIKARRLEKDLFQAAGRARALAHALEKVRSNADYLETFWDDRKLLVKRKFRRRKIPPKVKALLKALPKDKK